MHNSRKINLGPAQFLQYKHEGYEVLLSIDCLKDDINNLYSYWLKIRELKYWDSDDYDYLPQDNYYLFLQDLEKVNGTLDAYTNAALKLIKRMKSMYESQISHSKEVNYWDRGKLNSWAYKLDKLLGDPSKKDEHGAGQIEIRAITSLIDEFSVHIEQTEYDLLIKPKAKKYHYLYVRNLFITFLLGLLTSLIAQLIFSILAD